MTMDEFVDATIDVWDIPAESATRVGHPAPFPVELPRRLIELYTYRGDLVLDPFVGSGSTAVAAVRTERHYIGFDTDEEYVALAERRIDGERAAVAASASDGTARRRVTVSPGPSANPDSASPADAGGRCAAARQASWRTRPWRLRFHRHRTQRRLPRPGPRPSTSGPATRAAACGSSSCPGPISATRPGLRRPDVLWRALGKASVLHEVRSRDTARDDLGPLVLLSTDIPAARG